jgi:hypothetical protein
MPIVALAQLTALDLDISEEAAPFFGAKRKQASIQRIYSQSGSC